MNDAEGADRLPPLPLGGLSEEQQRYAEAIIKGPRGALFGPFVPLIRSPELMDCAQRMGEYLRYRNAIGTRLSELAILVTARQWTQQVEWAIHAPIAAQTGIAPAVIAAIADGRRPDAMRDDEAVVHDFCVELHSRKAVSDATWAHALALFGEKGVVDLLGINGYYTFLSMVMNGARTPALPSSVAPLVEPAR
jgi:4-carboxymuconolactone decarboxylase